MLLTASTVSFISLRCFISHMLSSEEWLEFADLKIYYEEKSKREYKNNNAATYPPEYDRQK